MDQRVAISARALLARHREKHQLAPRFCDAGCGTVFCQLCNGEANGLGLCERCWRIHRDRLEGILN